MTSDLSQQTPAPSAARRRIPRDWLLLALLWLIHAIAAVLWLRMDNRFPVGDAAVELTRALAVADALGQPSLDVLSRAAAASAGQPPLYYLATAPLVWLAGRGPDPATLVNLAWLALLMASVYSLTRRLFPRAPHPLNPLQQSVDGSPVALAATALVSLYPLVVLYTRSYTPALAVAALSALAVALLVESDGLQRRPYALGFGLAVAAGLLASTTFWAVVLGPALIAAAQALRIPRPARGSRRTPSRTALERLGRRLGLAPAQVNLLLVLLLIALALPFYLLRPGSELPTLPKSWQLWPQRLVRRRLLQPQTFCAIAFCRSLIVAKGRPSYESSYSPSPLWRRHADAGAAASPASGAFAQPGSSWFRFALHPGRYRARPGPQPRALPA